MSVTASPAWRRLLQHRDALLSQSPADLFTDPARLRQFEIALDGLRLNYSFQNATPETINLLITLAEQQQVAAWRQRMFDGEKINTTEDRAVLHIALRRDARAPLPVDGTDVMPRLAETRQRVAAFVDQVRTGQWLGATGQKIRHVVNIGIGGSDLGPRLAVQALHAFVSEIQAHFVANADAFELENLLKNLDPAETLFVVVSKTFTTQETLLNARSARRWLTEKLGEDAVAKHFVAVSVNRAEVETFGIAAANMFPIWDWVGGRFSLWSAVGLSVALAIGNNYFRDLLAGAAAMDAHFLTTPFSANMPVILALLGIWNRNFLGAPALAILPYYERLRDLPRFLQQLEMESNGKRVTRGGVKVDYETAPVIFGECGTVGQHSFHQCLHQGTTSIPADFIGVGADDQNQPEHHRALLANMVAQMTVLAFGQEAENPADIYPGRRSSNLILLDRLDPKSLGMLLALYEHKVFVQGIIWDINSFDQPGVELGKRMAKGLDRSNASGDAGQAASAFFAHILS